MSTEGASSSSAHGAGSVPSSPPPGTTVEGTEVALQPQDLPLRPFRNTGCSCYVNTSLQLLGTDSAFIHSLEGHMCESQCVICKISYLSLSHTMCDNVIYKISYLS